MKTIYDSNKETLDNDFIDENEDCQDVVRYAAICIEYAKKRINETPYILGVFKTEDEARLCIEDEMDDYDILEKDVHLNRYKMCCDICKWFIQQVDVPM